VISGFEPDSIPLQVGIEPNGRSYLHIQHKSPGDVIGTPRFELEKGVYCAIDDPSPDNWSV